MKAIFFHYRHSSDIIDRLICYLKIANKECATRKAVNTLVEFLLHYPVVVKKNKNMSVGMGLIMTNEESHAYQQAPSRGGKHQSDGEYIEQLVEFCWIKIMERHRTATSAFRAFDVRGKGAIKKGDLVSGFDKLRIKISNEDVDKVWSYLDQSSRGKVFINEFCAMGEQRAFKPQDTNSTRFF